MVVIRTNSYSTMYLNYIPEVLQNPFKNVRREDNQNNRFQANYPNTE